VRYWAPWLLVLGLLLQPAVAGAAVPVPAGFPTSGLTTYDVWRESSKVGTYSVDFLRDGDKLTVHTRIRIDVSLLFITLYRFDHDSVEDWVDGKLMRFISRTDDNGTDHVALLVRAGGVFRGQYDEEQLLLPGDIIPGTLWNPATVDQTRLIEPTKGQARAVTIFDRGMERLKVGSQMVQAHHYSITGALHREVWYGADGGVVQAIYEAKDDSLLTFKLRTVILAPPARPPGAAKP